MNIKAKSLLAILSLMGLQTKAAKSKAMKEQTLQQQSGIPIEVLQVGADQRTVTYNDINRGVIPSKLLNQRQYRKLSRQSPGLIKSKKHRSKN
ncbi:MAG: hypothetical protein ABIU30_18490 [Ferruginibacter sp.]